MSHSAATVFVLGDHFVQLILDDGCLPVKVDEAFWEHGVEALPPGRLVSLIKSDTDWAVGNDTPMVRS